MQQQQNQQADQGQNNDTPLVVEATVSIKSMELPIGRILEKALGELLTKSTRYDQLGVMIQQIENLKASLTTNLQAYKDGVADAPSNEENDAVISNNVKIAEVKMGLLDVYLEQAKKFRESHEVALAAVVTVPHDELINGLTEAVEQELTRQAEEVEAHRKAEEAAANASKAADAGAEAKVEELPKADAVVDEAPAPVVGVELSSKNAPAPSAPEVLTLGGNKSE